MHNRPIAKLIKWFVKREKGKLVDARIRNVSIRRNAPFTL